MKNSTGEGKREINLLMKTDRDLSPTVIEDNIIVNLSMYVLFGFISMK
jgi:hypothetical protein